VEALLHIAMGADCSAALSQRMGIDRSSVSRIVSLLTGRGTIGKAATRSNLRLVQRRTHPHRRGTQLALTQEGLDLLLSTFTFSDDQSNAPGLNRYTWEGPLEGA
jgi:DNA-binding MarR family transcriptional regulator